MARLATLLAVALCACHRAPARIYTDAELVTLEKRVLDEVAKTDASCSKPELLAFMDSVDDKCFDAYMKTNVRADAESNEIAAVDELCGAQVLAAFGRASVVWPSCSPYQIGVRAAPPDDIHGRPGPGDAASLHLAKLVSYHAERELDAYVGITELLVAARVLQDLARGRIDILQVTLPTAGEGMVIATSEKLLARSSLTREQLDDIAATLDAIIAAEPSLSDVLQGEALHIALHYGLAGLKPEDWQPPGGRDENTISTRRRTAADHDPRDDSAQVMAASLQRAETYARACPPKAPLTTCYANLSKQPMELRDARTMDEHSARVGMFPDDATRHDSQRQLLDVSEQGSFMVADVQRRAVMVARLVALRVHVQVLRDGRCPSEAQLAEAPYSGLRTPPVLGDTVPLVRNDDILVVDLPTWATATILQPITTKPPFPPPFKRPKPQPISIPCP